MELSDVKGKNEESNKQTNNDFQKLKQIIREKEKLLE